MSGTTDFRFVSPVDFRIAQVPEGLPPELVNSFNQVYASIQQLIFALVNNCGIGPRNTDQWVNLINSTTTLLSGNLNRFYTRASEPIAYGAAVNLYNNAGTLNARNANATNNTKPCRAFCSTAGGVATGAMGEFQIVAGVAEIAGLVPGTSYYLSTTNGLISAAAAVAVGNIEQYVGFAIDSTHLAYNVGYWIQH